MLTISRCLVIAIAVATVVVNNLNSKNKYPFDLES